MKSFTHSYYMCRCVSKLHLITWVITTVVRLSAPSETLLQEYALTRRNKRTNTHSLSCELHWQAVIPALAYESQQLEGVAVSVVGACWLCIWMAVPLFLLTLTSLFTAACWPLFCASPSVFQLCALFFLFNWLMNFYYLYYAWLITAIRKRVETYYREL